MSDKSEHIAARTQCYRVVAANFYGPPRKSCSLRDLPSRIVHPAEGLALRITQGCHAIGGSEILVDVDGVLEFSQRLTRALAGALFKAFSQPFQRQAT